MSPKPVLVGLDTASNRWHAVSGTNGGKITTTKCGPLVNKAWSNVDHRRHKLYDEAVTFFEGLPGGSHIFCEEPLALKNGHTTRVLSLAAGAIWAAHLSCDVFWHWVDVGAWKAAIVGKANADKALTIAWCQEWGICFDEEDWYDGYCLREYGRRQYLTKRVKEC